MEIGHGGAVQAQAYDWLVRRIRKIDSVAGTTNLYYYNDNWQVVCDYNDGDVTAASRCNTTATATTTTTPEDGQARIRWGLR